MSFWKGSKRRHHILQKQESWNLFLCWFYLTLPGTVVISVSAITEGICQSHAVILLSFTRNLHCGCSLWVMHKTKEVVLNWTNKHVGIFMGQRSHMLLQLSCLSNELCQSANLAPHAIREWDNESVFWSVSHPVWFVFTLWVKFDAPPSTLKNPLFSCFKRVKNSTFSLWGEAGYTFSSMTELIVSSYLTVNAVENQQLTIRLYCQIPHGSSAFSTVWPSNTHIFARSSLVSLVQTAQSLNPAEYFRFKRACLLYLHPLLFALLASSTVFA